MFRYVQEGKPVEQVVVSPMSQDQVNQSQLGHEKKTVRFDVEHGVAAAGSNTSNVVD